MLLLVAVVCVVFGNSLLNGFVWDDNIYLIGKRVYQDFDLDKIFFSLANGREYLPLRDFTYAVDYAVWGERAAGFHLTNLLLYLANIIAVYFLTRRLVPLITNEEPEDTACCDETAFCTALLFAVHPIHCEAVNWVACRNVLLSGLFFFSSCCCYLRYIQGKRASTGIYIAALLFFLCALLSKATSITLPLVLAVFAAFSRKERGWIKLANLAPFFVLSFVFFLIFKSIGVQTRVIDSGADSIDVAGIVSKIAAAVQIPYFYLWKLGVPSGFAPEYDVQFSKTLVAPALLAALTGALVMFVVAWRVRAIFPELLFCLGWILATLLPVMNLLPTNPIVADRYAYLPSFGFMYLLAACLTRQAVAWRRILMMLCVVLLSGWWSTAAFIRNTVWKSDKTLWQDAVKTTPRHAKAYVNLGNVLYREFDYDNSLQMFAKADGLGSRYDFYDLYQGLIHKSRGELPAAVVSLNKALQKNQNHIEALYNLGAVYEKLGEREHALDCYGKAILSPEPDSGGLAILAREARQRVLKMYIPQLDALKKRVADNPSDLNARSEQAVLLDKLGLYEDALNSYLDMEKSGVTGWQLFYNIANMYKKLDNSPEAARYYEKSLSLNPDFTDCLNNLGIMYRQMKQYPRAIEVFERAIKSNDSFASAPFNIATTYMLMGDKPNAVRYFTYAGKRFPQLRDKIAPLMIELEKMKN